MGVTQMTEIVTTSSPVSETVVDRVPGQTPVGARVLPLVTEQQVMLGTAAATLSPARSRGFGAAVHSVTHALQTAFVRQSRPARRPAVKRYGYLESSLMSREMNRL